MKFSFAELKYNKTYPPYFEYIVPEPSLARSARQLFFTTVQHPSTGPTWAFRNGNTCITSRNHIGTCTTYRSCYPYFKIPDITIWDSWILGNYDSCSFFNEAGRQTFGVCCSNPITTSTTEQSNTPAEESIGHDQFAPPPGSSQKENTFSNWPPPIPTHPPDHAAPTHPPSHGISTAPTTQPPPATSPPASTVRPPTTWPTRPTTPAASNWPPPLPTHSTPHAPPLFGSTTETPVDNEIGTCGAKNGNPVCSMRTPFVV